MIPNITELNFPKDENGKQYATLSSATVTLADMGESSITSQVKIDEDIAPDFSFDWAIEFEGAKYIMPLRIPQGEKGNDGLYSLIDLTFQHWAIYQLKRWPFVTIQQIEAGTYLADEEVASVQLNLKDFCKLCGQVLAYYYGDAIKIQLNPEWESKDEAILISISHTTIWDVFVDAFYNQYCVRWSIETAEDNDNITEGGERYIIKVGYPTAEISHIFEYGFEGGLLKIERQVQSENIYNVIKGRGGDTNIPFRYFKNVDKNNPDFSADPDWVIELKDIYFPNLMGATFRSYVQGWKAAHISQKDKDGNLLYPDYVAVGEDKAYSAWAYRKGFTDTIFRPTEFVADEITLTPSDNDRQIEVMPGYKPYAVSGSSLDKYGALPTTLDNNDEIYPTLQGTGLDIAVDVEQILSDDYATNAENDVKTEDKTFTPIVVNAAPGYGTAKNTANRTYFSVEKGKSANIQCVAGWQARNTESGEDESELIANVDYTLKVYNRTTGKEVSASGIGEGDWYFTAEFSYQNTADKNLRVSFTLNSVKIVSATPSNVWKGTFDIWVKNIWDSTRQANETDSQYSERIWKPILGDREGNSAKVMFTSGNLVGEDYEFTITAYPTPDTSKTWTDAEGVEHTSHWRITLAKSDADFESTGLYVPSTKRQGNAGDKFVFIGTEMAHKPYVTDAEIRLDDWKKDQLSKSKEIKPTYVVSTDRVRLNGYGKADALIHQLKVGASVRLADKRLISGAYETNYIQSITITYREPTSDDAALNPDVQIVLGEDYTASANPVSAMQGEISAIQRQLGSISNIEQVVRAVADKLYLRKDGIADRSLSPTRFLSLLSSGDFRSGLVGGSGWGIHKDENGNWVFEIDRVAARQDFTVNTFVINQAEGRGGMEIDTAAVIEVTKVEKSAEGYVCYFDQKGGSVANMFHVDDVAYCNRWTAEYADLKFYKRKVVAVAADSITLSDEIKNGDGIPAEGDNIIHFGSYTDKERQYVKIRDVVGGGYERYVEELNSVNAEGVEYFFIGKQQDEGKRWFIGNRDLIPYSGKGDGAYIEYVDGKFNLNNVSLSINSTVGDKTLGDIIENSESSAVSVQIVTDKGNVIFNGEGQRTLTALVFYRNENVTSQVSANRFSWTRVSDNAADDKVWNRLHEGVGNTCIVTETDINRNALFSCEVDIDGTWLGEDNG